jgi:hypothetical protein
VTITGQDFRTQSPTLSWHLSRAAPSLTFANTRRPENCFMRRYMLQKRTASSHSEYNFRKPYIANFHIARPFMIKPGALVQGESGRMYRLLSPLFAQVSKNASNVWRAVDEQDESLEFVVKEPSPHDDASGLFSNTKFRCKGASANLPSYDKWSTLYRARIQLER